jgi:amino acid transporter
MPKVSREEEQEEHSPMTQNGGDASNNNKVTMERQLGLMNGIAMIVGSIVGSGIFISPKGVLQSTGSAGLSIIVWALCGLVSSVGAICYAELGKYAFSLFTSITLSGRLGALYAFLNCAPIPDFLFCAK